MSRPPLPRAVRRGARRRLVWVLALAALPALAGAAHAKGPDIFPLAQVKKGQRGYGLTVFDGMQPERFDFEVIGVVAKMLPKQDLILVRSEDPKIIKVGFARGMSGSPLYIEGKVACAFSYGFPFTKGQIGACTPIEYMLADARRPLRGPQATALATHDEWRRLVPRELLERGAPTDTLPARPVDSWLARAPLPTPPAQSAGGGGAPSLVRLGIPLAVSGLGPTAFDQAKRIFEPYGIEPTVGGGAAADPNAKASGYVMGGAIGGQLARGDVSMVGTGTVSYVDGNRVLAFGHPFFQFGEVYMPAVTAVIHTVLPSYNMAFKMSSPVANLGSVVQDRQASILIDTRTRTEMIPVRIKIKGPNGADTFNAEVLRHRFLTPPLVGMMVGNAAQSIAPDVADTTVAVKSKLLLRGYEPLVFHDYRYSAEGAGNAIAGARGLRVLVPLLFNPYAPVHLEGVDVDVEIAYKADRTDINALRVTDTELPYGEKTFIEVILRPYGGKPYVERLPITIPERLAGTTVKIEVVAGDAARPDVAPPETLDQIITALRKTYPANTLVATIYTPDEGLTLGGKILADLPGSAMDTAVPATSTRRAEAYRSILRSVLVVKTPVQGRDEIVVKIKDRD